MNIQNNTILLTGGGSGIGLALAVELLKHNNQVLITGRNEAKLERAKAAHSGLEIFACDVTDEAQIQALVSHVKTHFGKLNILINNAGVYQEYDILEPNLELADLEKEISINLLGPIRMLKYFLPMLREESESAVVNVSSALAYLPYIKAPVYCGTKAGLHSFTLSLRHQLKHTSVKVFELMPPLVDTEMVSHVDLPKIQPEAILKAFINGLSKDKWHIRPGQTSALYIMSRLAPGFMQKQLNKAS